MIIFVRSLASIMMFCLPIFLYTLVSRQENIGLLFLIPIFGIVPALIAARFIFIPIESALDRNGMEQLKNVVIPMCACLFPIIIMIVMGLVSGSLSIVIERILSGGFNNWVIFGALWGGVWRVSEWVIRLIGMQTGG